MIPPKDTLLQAINAYYPDVWQFLMEDYKGDNETTKREKDARIDAEFLRMLDYCSKITHPPIRQMALLRNG